MTSATARWALGPLSATLLAFAAGCPDTSIGLVSASDASPDAGPEAGAGHPILELRQTLDLGTAGMAMPRGWLRFTAGGTRAYVADWGASAWLMTVSTDDGLLSPPTKLTMGAACNMSDIRFSADEQLAFIGSYDKSTCSQTISVFEVQSVGTFGPDAHDTAWPGSAGPAPDFAESIALHPSGAWLYVGFANRHPDGEQVVEDHAQIGRVQVAPDGSLSSAKVVADLHPSGHLTEVTLGFSPAGDALYAVEYETGNVAQYFVDGVTGDLANQPAMALANGLAELGPVCIINGREHVYVASTPPTGVGGGIYHFEFDGPSLESTTVAGPSDHPGLEHVDSIVADAECRYLYAVGFNGLTRTMLHVLEVDPATGATTWRSGRDGIAQLEGRQRLSISPDGRFLYTMHRCPHIGDCVTRLVHVFEIVAP